MWFRDFIPALLFRQLYSSAVMLSFMYCIGRQTQWGRFQYESSMLTTFPLKSVIGLKLAYLWQASLRVSVITLLYWTSGGMSLPSLGRFLFLTWSLAGYFLLFFVGGWGRRVAWWFWWRASRSLTSAGCWVIYQRSWGCGKGTNCGLRGSTRSSSHWWPRSSVYRV